jgi:DNA polymerase-4
VTLKIRFAPFKTYVRSVAVVPPTNDASAIDGAAQVALDQFDLDRPVRLLGVRADALLAD